MIAFLLPFQKWPMHYTSYKHMYSYPRLVTDMHVPHKLARHVSDTDNSYWSCKYSYCMSCHIQDSDASHQNLVKGKEKKWSTSNFKYIFIKKIICINERKMIWVQLWTKMYVIIIHAFYSNWIIILARTRDVIQCWYCVFFVWLH